MNRATSLFRNSEHTPDSWLCTNSEKDALLWHLWISVDILCQVVFRFVDKHLLVNELFPQSFRQREIPTRSWLVSEPLWEMISYRWVLLLVRIEKVIRTRRGHDSWPTVLNHLAWCELLRRFHVFSRLSPGNPPILRVIPKIDTANRWFGFLTA